MTNDSKVGTWAVAESSVTIEYAMSVIDEIRQVVAEGFQKLARGGLEVGGILYGTHDELAVRVLATRPIVCDHARGPIFVLSEKDKDGLRAQLEANQRDSRLDGLVPVGWYLSHTRSDITLTESDQQIFSQFFPEPWQVTLVIRPGRGGSMRAGFFVREADGTVQVERSYLDFDFPDRLAGILDQPPRERGSSGRPDFRGGSRPDPRPDSRPDLRLEPRPDSRPDSRPDTRFDAAPDPRDRRDIAPADEPPRRSGGSLFSFDAPSTPERAELPAPRYIAEPAPKRWPWIVALVVVVLAVGGYFGYQYMGMTAGAAPEPISLNVREADGQLRIEWNRAARPVTSATSGTLELTDGTDKKTVNLSAQDLALGAFNYVRKTGDVQVRMILNRAGGLSTQEGSRFLGGAPNTGEPGTSPSASAAGAAQGDMQEELERLRRENQQQQDRIQQLERTLTILRARLGIEAP